MSLIIKIEFNGDMRRKSFHNGITLRELSQDVMNTYSLENGSFILKFQENPIHSEEEFKRIIENNPAPLRIAVALGKCKKKKKTICPKKIIFNFPFFFLISFSIFSVAKIEEEPSVNPIPSNTTQEEPKPQVQNPKMPPIFSALFGNMQQPPRQPQQNPQQGAGNLFSMLPLLLGGMGGGMGGGSGMGGMFPAITQNLPKIIQILSENLPKEQLKELLIEIIKTIPREKLMEILKNALASPVVQEALINTLMGTFDKMSEPENNNEESKRQEETKRNLEEMKKQSELIKIKQQQEEQELLKKKREEEEKKRQIEEEKKKKIEEFKRQQLELSRQHEEQRKKEQLKLEEERRVEEQRRLEQLKIQEEQLKLKEQEEIKRQHEEQLKRQQELLKQEEINRQQELLKQEELKQLSSQRQKEEERMKYMKILQNASIPYESYKQAEELGLIESHGYENVVRLLIQHKGNVEMMANALFN